MIARGVGELVNPVLVDRSQSETRFPCRQAGQISELHVMGVLSSFFRLSGLAPWEPRAADQWRKRGSLEMVNPNRH